MTKPRAALAFSRSLNAHSISPAQRQRLEGMVELSWPAPIEDLEDPATRALLRQVEILITGWGLRPISTALLDAMPALRLIAHAAGTVKTLLPPEVWTRGIAVTHAAAANAVPVAEFTVAAILFSNKQVFRLRQAYAAARASRRPWEQVAPGLGNHRKTIGIVGASRIGRRVIELLRPFDFDLLVHDPFLDPEQAARLAVEAVDLDHLLARADVVSLHAPSLAVTRHMIDARRLALLRDGAVLINTARGALVDQDALLSELRSGRIDAVLDVTEPDVLPPDCPLYDLPNVFLTPHIAGALGSETQRMTELVLAEIDRFIRGKPLEHSVLATDLEHTA